MENYTDLIQPLGTLMTHGTVDSTGKVWTFDMTNQDEIKPREQPDTDDDIQLDPQPAEPPHREPPPMILRREDLEKLERQIIPLLNTIRRILGKGPLGPIL